MTIISDDYLLISQILEQPRRVAIVEPLLIARQFLPLRRSADVETFFPNENHVFSRMPPALAIAMARDARCLRTMRKSPPVMPAELRRPPVIDMRSGKNTVELQYIRVAQIVTERGEGLHGASPLEGNGAARFYRIISLLA